MPETGNAELVARLERIERENRILKRFVALVALAAGALFMMAQTPARPRILDAEKLIIRHPNGKEAIVLSSIDRPGDIGGTAAEASFYRADGTKGVSILADRLLGSVNVLSPKYEVQMGMNAGNYTIPVREYATLSVSRIPPGRTKSDAMMFELRADGDGEVTQTLLNADGALVMLLNGREGPAVTLTDDTKKARAILGQARLTTPKTGGVELAPVSSLTLFDKEGKVLWRAP